MKQSTSYRQIGIKPLSLGCALVLGVLADVLLRAPGRAGLSVAVWVAAVVLVLAMLQWRRDSSVAVEVRWLMVGALGFAAALTGRDAEALAVFSLFAVIVLLTLAAGHAAASWASRARVSEVVFATGRVAVLSLVGPLGWRREPIGADGLSGHWSAYARTVMRGTAMALPALLVLTILLMSADPVFADMVEGLFRFEIEAFIEHAVFIAFMAWLAAGFLRAFLVSDDVFMHGLRVPRPDLAVAEVAVALWTLNLLFLVFMAVQLRYLFGGSDLVEVTAGLSYAEYARRGFFELVATAALVLPILLLADWSAAPGTRRARNVLRRTALVLVVLLLGIIASAAYRMWLYLNAYGLTELRLYVSVFIVWLTAVSGWLVFTVLRGRHERFAFGAIMSGIICIAVLHVLNPHALIARVNLERAAAGAEYDGSYLRTLSADAVPVLVRRLDGMPEPERRRIGCMLEQRWGGERPGGWHTWNLGDWRARRLVGALDRTHCPPWLR